MNTPHRNTPNPLAIPAAPLRLLPRRLRAAAALAGLLLATSWLAVSPARAEPAPAGETMKWRTDLDAALADAGRQHKLVLLRFTAEWCAPCRVMDAKAWPDKAVQAVLADQYLAVKSDVDAEAGRALGQKYGIQGIPALILLDPEGNELARGAFMSPPALVKFLTAPTAKPGGA
jgi:thiol:disulfide interchange protein